MLKYGAFFFYLLRYSFFFLFLSIHFIDKSVASSQYTAAFKWFSSCSADIHDFQYAHIQSVYLSYSLILIRAQHPLCILHIANA